MLFGEEGFIALRLVVSWIYLLLLLFVYIIPKSFAIGGIRR